MHSISLCVENLCRIFNTQEHAPHSSKMQRIFECAQKSKEISDISAGSVLDKDEEDTHIPMHRVRIVKKKDKIIWKR